MNPYYRFIHLLTNKTAADIQEQKGILRKRRRQRNKKNNRKKQKQKQNEINSKQNINLRKIGKAKSLYTKSYKQKYAQKKILNIWLSGDRNRVHKLLKPEHHVNLPRIPSYIEVNLTEQIKRFQLGKEKNELQINVFPIVSPPDCYYIESKFLINQNYVVIHFGGMFSHKQSGIDSTCLQLLHWLCSTLPYKDYFSDSVEDPDYSIIRDDDFELPSAPEPLS